MRFMTFVLRRLLAVIGIVLSATMIPLGALNFAVRALYEWLGEE